jgi:phosphoribosylformimino-5-aminoimidazole carboxamide ribotide isomerase
MEIIPAIDILGGHCVRLYQGDFAQVTRYDVDPVELAAAYRAAGSARLHVVDLDGARTGTPGNLAAIGRIAATAGLAVQAGGGVRSLEMARRFIDAGADRVVVGSVAINDPPQVLGWLADAGPERFVLAFDVRIDPATGTPLAVTHGWQDASGKSLWPLMETFLAAGARDFLCTDVGRDGTLAGPNTALYRDCTARFPEARVIASGGLGSAVDLAPLAATGVAAVVTGKALLDGRLTLEEIRTFSRAG